jgi:DNA-binding CsgD family transcriptional regulator
MRPILGRPAGVSHRGKPPDFWAGPGLRAGAASLLVTEEMALTALMAPTSRSVLLERNLELAQVESALAEASNGSGKLVVVEGRAGTGKTALVDAARDLADANGMRVMRARATELESGFAWGVVRQLFEPILFAETQDELDDLLQGDAALAAALLGLPGAPLHSEVDERGDPSFVILHGLYWLLASLSAQRPVLVVVDDLHWADGASLRYLAFLLTRLSELRVAVLLVARTGAAGTDEKLLATLTSDPVADVIRLAPLSDDSAAYLLERSLGELPDPVFVDAVMNATGGTPFLVSGVVDDLQEEGIAPSAEAAADVERIGVRVGGRSVRLQLNQLPAHAGRLAKALAVLHESDLPTAARLAGLDEADGAAAYTELVSAGIFCSGQPLAFAHPILRRGLYADMPGIERAQIHYEAARLLSVRPTAHDAVAEHLLASEPRGETWVVEKVVAAARAAAGAGAPRRAAVLFGRALAEPPPPEDEPQLLLELGSAEASAGLDGWCIHLEAAVDAASEGRPRADAARLFARALNRAQRFAEAVEVLDRAAASLDPGDELALELEAAAVVVGMNDPTPTGSIDGRRSALRARAENGMPVPAELLAAAAFSSVLANEPAEVGAALATRALHAAGEKPSTSLVARTTFTLLVAERFEQVRPLIDDSIVQARRAGDSGRLSAALASRAWLALRRGDLFGAETDARTALAAAQLPAPPVYRALNGGILLKALIDQGRLETADELAAMFDSEAEGKSITAAVLRLARGRLRLEQGRATEGLSDFVAVGELLTSARIESPGYLPWRSEATHAHLALGDHEEAVRLAEAELEAARYFGAPRALGVAARAAGLAAGGDRGIALLEEAIDAFDHGGAVLERGRALADLGALLRRRNQRVAARALLRDALDIAHRVNAGPLATYADTELRATGARPRRALLTGPESLTASERRIADLAGTGLTNREIAQMLFITARTVEGHLTNVFRKLRLDSRTDLGAALTGRTVARV